MRGSSCSLLSFFQHFVHLKWTLNWTGTPGTENFMNFKNIWRSEISMRIENKARGGGGCLRVTSTARDCLHRLPMPKDTGQPASGSGERRIARVDTAREFVFVRVQSAPLARGHHESVKYRPRTSRDRNVGRTKAGSWMNHTCKP